MLLDELASGLSQLKERQMRHAHVMGGVVSTSGGKSNPFPPSGSKLPHLIGGRHLPRLAKDHLKRSICHIKLVQPRGGQISCVCVQRILGRHCAAPLEEMACQFSKVVCYEERSSRSQVHWGCLQETQ